MYEIRHEESILIDMPMLAKLLRTQMDFPKSATMRLSEGTRYGGKDSVIVTWKPSPTTWVAATTMPRRNW